MFKLFPYQETGVRFLLDNARCLLADEPGCGKSFQVLEACVQLHRTSNVLIICPASLTLMWDKFIKEFIGPSAQIVHLKREKDSVALIGQIRFVIVSYNFIQKAENVARLCKVKWNVIVADEAHAIKSPKAKTTKGFRKLCKTHGGYVWLLTGTPATRSGQDYYVFLDTIQPGKWGTYTEFSELFCNSVVNYWSGRKDYTGVKESKAPILKQAFKKIMLRRLKEDVLKELPPKLVTNLPVEVDQDVINKSLGIDADSLREIILSGKEPKDPHLAKIMQAVGIAKMPAAIEYAVNLDAPLVIFCCHTLVLRSIEKGLLLAGKTVSTVMGEDSQEEKNKAVEDFQNGKIDFIICNIKAGGVGITLHRASHVLMVEFPWSPAVYDQACDRLHRFGQKASCVNVVNLVGYKTLDETIIETLATKAKFMKQVMGDV